MVEYDDYESDEYFNECFNAQLRSFDLGADLYDELDFDELGMLIDRRSDDE